jgi:hypothetical protein
LMSSLVLSFNTFFFVSFVFFVPSW